MRPTTAPHDEADFSDQAILCPLSGQGQPITVDRLTQELCSTLTVGGCPLASGFQERLEFERLLVDVSASFVNLPTSKIDEQIEHSMRRLGEFLGIERSSFAEFSENNRDMIVTHCYVAPGVAPFPPIIVEGTLPWYAAMIRTGEIQRFSRLPEQLPAEAVNERAYCIDHGLKSNLAIPLRSGESLRCVITFASFREYKDWPDELVQRLWLIGQIFANSLERKRSEEETRHLRDELARMGRVTLVGELAAAIAHEISQPLCAIISNARATQRLLSAENTDLVEVRETLRDIAADSLRANEVMMRVRRMLQKQQPERNAMQLNDAIRDVVTLVHGQLIHQGVSLAIELKNDLPEVFADRVQLQQVLINLMLNAVDAMSQPDVATRQLAIQTESIDTDRVMVTVRDSGPGIPDIHAASVFESFFTTKPTGIGVGLAISRSIVESHGGRLWLDLESKPGATFHFTLPVATETPA